MNLYTYDVVRNLIDEYVSKGGEIIEIEEGVLGYGRLLLHDFKNKLKTIIINEVALNEWSSAHTIRMYNKCPKKYEKFIDEL